MGAPLFIDAQISVCAGVRSRGDPEGIDYAHVQRRFESDFGRIFLCNFQTFFVTHIMNYFCISGVCPV